MRVLADWFRQSLDNWKRKYMDAKTELKRAKVRVSDIAKSRSRWREKFEASQQELEVLQAEFERFRNQVSERPSEDEPSGNNAPSVEKKGVPIPGKGS